MAEDTRDDEMDVFEIDDFTAASEWERFINRMEEIIGAHGWKLNSNNTCKSNTEQTTSKPSKSLDSVTGIQLLSIIDMSIPSFTQTNFQSFLTPKSTSLSILFFKD